MQKHTRHHLPLEGHNGHGGGGYDHHRMMIEDFKRRPWDYLVMSVPVLVLIPMVQHIHGYSLDVPYSMHTAFILSSIIFFYGGWPFLAGLAEEVKKGTPDLLLDIMAW